MKMMFSGTGPSRAAASTVPIVPSESSSPETRAKPRTSSSSAHSLQSWLEQPIPLVISRNFFVEQLDYFPMDGSRATEHSRTGSDASFWDELAKSVSSQ